jgi:hypothetical protein
MVGLVGLPTVAASSPINGQNTIAIETIKEFVAAGHNDLDKVKAMLQPALRSLRLGQRRF